MKVQNSKNNQPNFGLKVIRVKSFESVAKENKWEHALDEMIKRVEAKFPEDKRTFEISPNHILAETQGDTFGPTYQFSKQKDGFASVSEIENAIEKTVKGRKLMEQIPAYVQKLNKRHGISMNFNPKGLCDVAGNNVRGVMRVLSGVAKAVADTPKKQMYGVRVYSNGSSYMLTAKVSRDGHQAYSDFLILNSLKHTEKNRADETRNMIDSLKEELMASRKKQHKAQKAAAK